MTSGSEWVNVSDAADAVHGLSYAKLHRWVAAGLVPSVAPNGGGSGNLRYIHASTVDALTLAVPIHEGRKRQTIADVLDEVGLPDPPEFVGPATPRTAGRSIGLDRLAMLIEYETDDCIVWPFGRYPSGYARLSVDGKSDYAHRHALIMDGRMPTAAKNITRHLCNNKPCVNPRHLEWGTQQENVDDRTNHGVWAEAMRKRSSQRGAA